MTDAVAAFEQCREWRQQYDADGFVIVRQMFDPVEIARLRDETDALLRGRRDLISPHNLRCRYMPHHETGELLFEVFDPVVDISPACRAAADHPRLRSLLEAVYGEPGVLFKDKLIFKPAGARGYNLHQDIPLSWASFPRSFATVLIAIDDSTRANGCTQVFRGYHRDFLSCDPAEYMLPDDCVDAGRGVWLELAPGDAALFHGLTPHRSEPNRSPGMRRALYVSYNALSDGGDQRETHYAEFQQKMRSRLVGAAQGEAWFR